MTNRTYAAEEPLIVNAVQQCASPATSTMHATPLPSLKKNSFNINAHSAKRSKPLKFWNTDHMFPITDLQPTAFRPLLDFNSQLNINRYKRPVNR
ncbi:MAG: hypothetical protein KJP20_00740, partial [Bacteroidia bacterium]|nr:hypothetical protein [Bacteroidia bacterium]